MLYKGTVAHIEEERRKGKVPVGEVKLNPHWDIDYSEMLKNYLKL